MTEIVKCDTNPEYTFLKKILAKKALHLASGIMLLGIFACRFTPPDEPTSTPMPIVGIDELRFKDPETGRRFRSLNSCINDMVDKTWRTTSYQVGGNFYESKWCRGDGAGLDCQIADATIDNRDQNILELNTLFYPQDYPEVFGLGFHSLWVPKVTGWGALFSFDEGGSSVVGDGWSVNFSEYKTSTAQPEAKLYLGEDYFYSINNSPIVYSIEYSSGLPMREDLGLYLAKPDAMRDRGLAQIQALAQKVKGEIRAHQVKACDLQPYKGGGIPPACTPRPMTAGEEALELAQAETYFTEQEQLLDEHYQEMYAAWMNAFPLNQCWP